MSSVFGLGCASVRGGGWLAKGPMDREMRTIRAAYRDSWLTPFIGSCVVAMHICV